MSASNRLDLNIDQDRNDETRNVENFKDGDYPALRPKYDRRAHAQHKWFLNEYKEIKYLELPEHSQPPDEYARNP